MPAGTAYWANPADGLVVLAPSVAFALVGAGAAVVSLGAAPLGVDTVPGAPESAESEHDTPSKAIIAMQPASDRRDLIALF